MKRKFKCCLVSIFLLIINGINLHASDLKWDISTGEVSGYTIYYGLSQGSYPFSEDVGNITQYSLDNFLLSEDATYYFVVRSYNAFGESGNSNMVIYTTPSSGDTTPPLPPEDILDEIINEDIFLTWQANSEVDISGYWVYYGTSSRNYGLPIPADGTEYLIVGLESGTTYYIAVSAVDTSGNESGYSSPELITMIGEPPDTTAPVVAITSPTADPSYYTETASLGIGGTASDNKAVTHVTWTNSVGGNIASVTAGGNGIASGTDNWIATGINLTEGENIITITAGDAAGNESTDQLTVTYAIPDITEPSIVISAPISDASYNAGVGNITISGTASDNNAVTARDEANNESTDVLTVTYTIPDTTAPVVAITSPTSNPSYSTESSSLDIGGTASDATGVTQVTWSNSAGGNEIVSGTGNWSVTGINLIEGENIITITAMDEAGNKSSDSIAVQYAAQTIDNTPPVISLNIPTTRRYFFTRSASVNLSGNASDNIGIKKILWNNSKGGSGKASGISDWNVSDIALTKYRNTITITAIDFSGNKSVYTLFIFSWY